MKNNRPAKKYIPFTYKMMIPYLVLVLITDLLVGYISYTMLIESRTEMAETNIRTALKQTRTNLQYQINEIKRMSDIIFNNAAFQTAMQNQGEPLEVMLAMRDHMTPQLRGPLQLYGNHLRLAVYASNDRMLEIEGDDMSTPIERSDYYVLQTGRIENTPWFQSIVEQNRDRIWAQVGTDREFGHISYFRKLVSSTATVIGYVRVTARLDELLGNFGAFPIDRGVQLRLMDSANQQVLYDRGQLSESAESGAYLIVREDIPETNYAIETYVPYAYLREDASRLQQVIGTVCAISFLVMAFIGYFVARLSGKKIKRIVTLVQTFQEGNFHKRIGFSGNDEFVRIAEAFNHMAANIQKLIENVYEQGLQKKQAELDALQAQINPHFLYNTLSTIGSLSNLGETGKVTAMVQGLSKFYRLTINQGNASISLEKELEQVQTYLEIQNVKYAGRFKVYYDIDPEILQVPVIKLILQPFVENVFKHAWYEGSISILIKGRRLGERIELKIIDNGVGMKRETLESMREMTPYSDRYGLKNVEERIQLRYGPEYGVQMASCYGAGTAVRILLPIERARSGSGAEAAE